jgi:hypothetical protein
MVDCIYGGFHILKLYPYADKLKVSAIPQLIKRRLKGVAETANCTPEQHSDANRFHASVTVRALLGADFQLGLFCALEPVVVDS